MNSRNSAVIISSKSSQSVMNYFSAKGFDLIQIDYKGIVYDEISTHPDIFSLAIGGRVVIPKGYSELKGKLEKYDCNVVYTSKELGFSYPDNVLLNAAIIGNCIICNTKSIDPVILEMAKEAGFDIHHVNQGYSNCSIMQVDDNSFITSDKGIYDSLKNVFDILLVDSDGIKLGNVGMKGFIGGCAASYEDEIIFNGNLEDHPDSALIRSFITLKGKRIVSDTSVPFEDMGGATFI